LLASFRSGCPRRAGVGVSGDGLTTTITELMSSVSGSAGVEGDGVAPGAQTVQLRDPGAREQRCVLLGRRAGARCEVRLAHRITIRARPVEIWPMARGSRRWCRPAGSCSYDGLDNGGVASAERIVPELQRAEVTDIFPMTPTADEVSVVRAVGPVPALVLGDPVGLATRALVLEPVDETSSRPATCVRAAYERSAAGLMIGLVLRPIPRYLHQSAPGDAHPRARDPA
jgi:hypothetical protein